MADNATPDKTPIAAGLDAATQATADKFTVRNALEVLHDKTPEPPEIWGSLQLVSGQIMELIGPSGLGKSRLVLDLAISQICGECFAGLPTYRKPLTWLFYGNENTKFRFRKDLSYMTHNLSKAQKNRLKKHLWLPTMEKFSDFDISLSNPENEQKLVNTLLDVDADVLVMDPWGSVINGDELNDGDVHRTVATIQRILARRKKPTVAIILNHSRNGLKEMINAWGPERANYGKNSKSIFTIIRCVWNIRNADFNHPAEKIELINAKASDKPEYEPRAVQLDPETNRYKHVADFNHAVWQQVLEDAYSRGTKLLQQGEKANAAETRDEMARQNILKYIAGQEAPVPNKEVLEWIHKSIDMGKDRRNGIYQDMIRNGIFLRVQFKERGAEYMVWTTEKMEEYLKTLPTGSYSIIREQRKVKVVGGTPPNYPLAMPLKTT